MTALGGYLASNSRSGEASAGSRNALAPYLTAIDQIVVMTPQVIEIRLSAPRPDLLSILAQPELAIFQARGLAGSTAGKR